MAMDSLKRFLFWLNSTRLDSNTEGALEKDFTTSDSFSREKIDLMTGFEFESLLGKLFAKMGYQVEQTKLSGDQGADLIMLDKFGEKIIVQAKRSNSPVGNSAIQEVSAAVNHYKAHLGIVVTNNYFTISAKELAESNKIILFDRDKLKELIKEHYQKF